MKSGSAITSDNISETGYYPVYGGNGIRGYTDRHTHDGQFVLIGRQGALCGNVHFVNGQFWASEHAVVVTVGRNLVPRFSYYLLGEMNLNQYSVAAAQPGLAVNRVLALLGVLPPLPEQRAIVAYLDRETARLDDLIDKKRRLLALLKERRTAVITHAVTKGLPADEARAAGLPVDPTMKDSGVEWIGEVPDHWGTVPIWHIADFVNGAVFPPAEWATEGTPIIRIANLNGSDSFNYSTESVSNRFHVTFGDLLFGWSGNRGTSFGPFIWKKHGLHYLNQHIFKVYSKNIIHEYLYWILKAVTEVIESEAHGIIGMVHITATKLGSIRVPLPSIAEQAAIGDYLVRETARLDDLAAKVEAAIAALGEYRTALITAAVTGQVDVRGAVEA
jgi:type I restriction enzyme S subunit